jgi:intermediate peptidase
MNLQKAKGIVEKVLRASSTEEYKAVARDLDRLSDILCRVIDLSDFVRSTHPDYKIQAAASCAHAKMFEYMNVLNTTTGLNEQLSIAMANQEVMSGWSEEEKVVAKSLKRDFAKSAISLPRAIRERFVSLSQDISEIGHAFVEEMAPAQETITIPSSKLKGMDPILARSLTSWGQVTLPTVGDLSTAALRSVHDEDTRRDIFMASKTASQKQIIRLEELLRNRAELASITGYNSYSELALGDKMAKSPQSVNQFLEAVSRENKPRVQKEMGDLLKAKMRDPNASTPLLQPWDKEFYTFFYAFYISQYRLSIFLFLPWNGHAGIITSICSTIWSSLCPA